MKSLVQSGRRVFVVANTIIDEMNTLADPRRTAFFDNNIAARYIGGNYGAFDD